jgi:hypothetical protein
VQRVEAGHRLLEDEADVVAPDPAQPASGADHLAVVGTDPVTVAESGSSDTVDSAVTDLPEPDSPTSATVSPGPREATRANRRHRPAVGG